MYENIILWKLYEYFHSMIWLFKYFRKLLLKDYFSIYQRDDKFLPM